jgi:hypothetical protein
MPFLYTSRGAFWSTKWPSRNALQGLVCVPALLYASIVTGLKQDRSQDQLLEVLTPIGRRDSISTYFCCILQMDYSLLGWNFLFNTAFCITESVRSLSWGTWSSCWGS